MYICKYSTNYQYIIIIIIIIIMMVMTMMIMKIILLLIIMITNVKCHDKYCNSKCVTMD